MIKRKNEDLDEYGNVVYDEASHKITRYYNRVCQDCGTAVKEHIPIIENTEHEFRDEEGAAVMLLLRF